MMVYNKSLSFTESLPVAVTLRNFYDTEVGFVWSKSTWAELHFSFDFGKRAQPEFSDLVIDFDVFKSPPMKEKQAVMFYLNGVRVGNFDVTARDTRVILFPTSLLRQRNNVLTIDTPEAVAPSSLGEGEDHRQLGIQLFSLQFQPA